MLIPYHTSRAITLSFFLKIEYGQGLCTILYQALEIEIWITYPEALGLEDFGHYYILISFTNQISNDRRRLRSKDMLMCAHPMRLSGW